jgi:hypothetical protein
LLKREISEPEGVVDRLCAIPGNSQGGDDLYPDDLYLTIGAALGHMTDSGYRSLDDLKRLAGEGEFAGMWLHGMKPMSCDGGGFIYYKDKQVEYYQKSYLDSLQAKRDLTELRSRCVYLEQHGIEISCDSAIWFFQDYEPGYSKEKQTELEAKLAGGGLTFSEVLLKNRRNDEIRFFLSGDSDWDSIKISPEFQDFYRSQDSNELWELFVHCYHYGGKRMVNDKEVMTILSSCFDYLSAGGFLDRITTQKYIVFPESVPDDEVTREPAAGDEDAMEV